MSETEDPGISLNVLRNFSHMRNRPTIISYKPPEGKKQLVIDWVPENLGFGSWKCFGENGFKFKAS